MLGFARQRLVALMHDSRFVLVFGRGDEFVGIDDHAFPAIVIARVEIEHEHDGLNGDDHAHQRRDLEAGRADDVLFGKKNDDALAQARELRIGVDRQKGKRFERFAPQRFRDGCPREDALAFPFAQGFEHFSRRSRRARSGGFSGLRLILDVAVVVYRAFLA